MIELEWKALTEGITKSCLTFENDYCKQLGARLSCSAGGHFLRPSLRPQVVLAPSSPRRTMAAMVDLLLRRAPAASGEVYDVLRGCPASDSSGARGCVSRPGPTPILTRSTCSGREARGGRGLGPMRHPRRRPQIIRSRLASNSERA